MRATKGTTNPATYHFGQLEIYTEKLNPAKHSGACLSEIPVLGKWRLEDQEFKLILGYVENSRKFMKDSIKQKEQQQQQPKQTNK